MKSNGPFIRIYRLKLLLTGAVLVILGLLTSALSDWLSTTNTWHVVTALVSGLADVFLVTGAIGIAVDFFTGRDRDAADTERTRSVLKELTPDFTEAVLKGLAVDPDDLKRVAKPELLDDIATNALGLRLGDDQFAREIYAEVRDQAIRAAERWYDVDVTVRLSSAVERSAGGAPLLDAVVEWEYTTVPSRAVRRFACVSDREEYDRLRQDESDTVRWFMRARPGLDATDRRAYEVLEFAVDGEQQQIRRSTRRAGQTYSVRLPEKVLSAKQVRMRHVFKTRTAAWGHRLYVEVSQPTRGFSLKVDYTDTDIAELAVTDMVSTVAPTWVSRSPAKDTGRTMTVEVPGWLMPKSGFAFTWVRTAELPRSERAEAA